MRSAAEQVFAIPELLEQILILVPTADRKNNSGQTSIGFSAKSSLFVLQRVNKGFHNVIATSPKLSRMMGLKHVMPIGNLQDQIAREEGYLDSILNLERLSYDVVDSDLMIRVALTRSAPWAARRLETWIGGLKHQENHIAGVQGLGTQTLYHHTNHSWRSIFLTTTAIPVRIEIRVRHFKSFHSRRGYILSRHVLLSPEEATLGRLADELTRLNSKWVFRRLPVCLWKYVRARQQKEGR
jgi:hypothetical protein